jgi:nicotinamidase/pyrazinamidase
VDTLYIGGLATDYCVFYSAMDAVRLGYKTRIVADAVKGVGYPEGSVEKALKEMEKAGIALVNSGDIG